MGPPCCEVTGGIVSFIMRFPFLIYQYEMRMFTRGIGEQIR
jgi:hypothetical protein